MLDPPITPMLTSIAALFILAATHVGVIHVFVEPGFDVYLDSRPIGKSTSSEGGLQIREVPAGEHEVTVKGPTGRAISSRVTVFAGNTAGVSISSLGLRSRGADESMLEVQVQASSATCQLLVGGERIISSDTEMRADHLKPGQYRILLTCGSRSASINLSLPAGRILTLHGDLATGRIKVIGDRPRITSVVVPAAEDAIMRMPIPVRWKRVFAAALSAGVKAKQITQVNDIRASAVYVAPDYSAMEEVAERIRARDEVETVYIEDYRRTADGLVFQMRVTFRM